MDHFRKLNGFQKFHCLGGQKDTRYTKLLLFTLYNADIYKVFANCVQFLRDLILRNLIFLITKIIVHSSNDDYSVLYKGNIYTYLSSILATVCHLVCLRKSSVNFKLIHGVIKGY